MDPLTAVAIGAGASQSLGSMFDLYKGISAGDSAEDLAAAQFALQWKLAHRGIQMRVADANKAGVHPLYALGAPPMGGSPIPLGESGGDKISRGLKDMGQAALSTAGLMMQRERHAKEMELINSNIRLNDAQAKSFGVGNPPQGVSGVPFGPVPVVPGLESQNTYTDRANVVPGESYSATSGNPSLMAGKAQPYDQLYNVFGNPFIMPRVPEGIPADAHLQGMSWPVFIELVRKNADRFGRTPYEKQAYYDHFMTQRFGPMWYKFAKGYRQFTNQLDPEQRDFRRKRRERRSDLGRR